MASSHHLRRADGGGDFDDRRRAIQIGDSLGVTIPAEFVNSHDLKPRDEIGINETDDGIEIVFPD